MSHVLQELTESEDRYHSLVEHINDGVMLYQSIDDGGDFVILDINTAGERITRFYKQQVVGKRVTEVFPGIRKLGLLEKLKQVYRTGSEGRNTYRFYTEAMTQAANERLILESRLRRAIELDELSVYYQPLLNVMTQEIVGFEALVRWLDPDEGLILPDRFTPVAEETGSISAIGEWVLETACREVMDWRGKGGEPGILSVNLSGRQFHNQRLAMHVSDILDRSGMQASWLELEITESVLMELSEKTVRNLQELEKLGVRLSIDDFGTGYSSLAYLKRFKIDKLKIDQAFVRGVPGDASDVEITSTIIAMAKNLRIQVLAEGVENQQQLAFLQGQACDQYQGYYYSKPLPAGEALQLLLKGGVEDIPG
ncbi:MAG: EAL domain-containing protein [Candidatus Thiodiazotropha sp. (ex Dulcina madagascariensis)]|nr:EAL domain-containing protein [Candidatus Thiodiazotropha sp. (ex Dulcina madagascariensis)]